MKDHRFRRIIATAAALLALAAPSALAVPAEEFLGPVDASNAGDERFGPTQSAAGREDAPATTSLDDGFDWGSAGVGAGVAGGLVLLSITGLGMVARGRQPAR